MRKMWSKGVGLLVIGGMVVSLAACTKAETSNTNSSERLHRKFQSRI